MQYRTSVILFTIFFILCLAGLNETVSAQVAADSLRPVVNDTIPPVVNDTIPPAQLDTSSIDTTSNPLDFETGGETQANQRSQGATGDVVNFEATDSLTFDFRGQRMGKLYGSANVSHPSGSLDAGIINLDLMKSQVEAQSPSPDDTLSYPVLSQDDQDIRSTRVLFNYETEKGKFEVAEVQVSDGYLIGTQIKNVSESEVFIEDGVYSSCPPEHMYYYIQAQRMKLIDEEEIFFTNARLYILDIPYPLIFPFGYVPAGIDQQQSGLLEPTYLFENSSSRGLGLQNLGWFQYFNDYLVGQTSFDIFTSGTFFNQTRFQYRKTEDFSGSLTLGYSREQGLEPTDLNFSETISRRLGLNHDQQLSPYANLTANINLNTSDYFQRNSFDIDERAQRNSNSRVNYRYSHPEGLYNFALTSRLNQQFDTGSATLTGPEMNFSLRQFSPFESDGTSNEQAWYERISINYSNNFSSEFNFTPLDQESPGANWLQALFDPSLHREVTGSDQHVEYGFEQQARVSAGQIIPSQFLNISANINFNEYWYPTTTRREFNEAENEVEEFKERGFSTAREFNTSLNFGTTFYGLSEIKIGNLEGLRHTVRPNFSLSYRPDFSDRRWGFYEEVQTDSLGNTQRFSRFDREVFGGPSRGEQQTINFGVTNILETKRVKRDSTGEVQSSNLRLIDNLSIDSGYNFAADSLNFSNVNITLSSRLFDQVRLSANANYSVYEQAGQNRQIDRYVWQDDGKLLQPLSYSVTLSTSFSGGQQGGKPYTPPYLPYDPYNQQFFSPIDQYFNDRPIQPLDSPWSLGLDFSYRWTYQFEESARKQAVLNASNIQFRLSQKWNVSTKIGYDFIEKELTPSQFRLTRQMVCWNLSFQFNPFGDFQYYSFRLSLDSGQISSIFQKLPGLNNLERSSSPSGQPPPRF
ncbi:MAG: putative LPS assembly protein LptD [Balneolaceae bacterium]